MEEEEGGEGGGGHLMTEFVMDAGIAIATHFNICIEKPFAFFSTISLTMLPWRCAMYSESIVLTSRVDECIASNILGSRTQGRLLCEK